MATIYLIINKISGKIYIGKTVKNLWKKRWIEHKSSAFRGIDTYLYKAIRLYGPDAFDIVKIDEAATNAQVSELEKHYIKVFESFKPQKGYNLTFGGEGCSGTPESCRKRSETMKRLGIKPPPKPPGWKPSAEHMKKLSESLRGKPSWNKGKPHTEKHKLALRKPKAPYIRNGKQVRSDIPTEEVIRLYDNGKGATCRVIATLFNTNKETIARRLRKAGVSIRPVGFQKKKLIEIPLESANCGATSVSIVPIIST